MSKLLILFASTDRFFSSSYIRKLTENNFQVQFCNSATEVAESFAAEKERPALLITGMVLAHGKEFTPHETRSGLRTGMVLYKWVRKQNSKMPVIILSSESVILAEIDSLADPLCRTIDKNGDDSKKQLLNAVRSMTR